MSEKTYPHNWVKSTLGHGEKQCTQCASTNREIAAIGDMNRCEKHPALVQQIIIPIPKNELPPMSVERQKPLRQIMQERLALRYTQYNVGTREHEVTLPEKLFNQLVEMAMSNPIYMVEEFHRKFGHPVVDEFVPNHSLQDLRIDLLKEELEEYIEADENCNEMEMIDALCDIVVVAIGAALALGLPFRLGFLEVHRSNMSKLGADGLPIYREDGKILKGPDYSPPNWVEVFREWISERGKV